MVWSVHYLGNTTVHEAKIKFSHTSESVIRAVVDPGFSKEHTFMIT